ncbi:lysophospholipid acyltransferase family protein [Dokdonella sp. MW10]|uniref:lysophospholipid acyltransferase family protein n=1 Tax=Dokdonella sp. MW10 TaxID=2992926 RepID=UPI003F7FC382
MSPTRLVWAVLNALQLLFTLAWTGVLIVIAYIVRIVTRGTHWPLRMASRCWSPGLLTGAGVRFEVHGAEGIDWSRPHVFVANHQSMIDVCAMFRAVRVPLRFVLKQELSRAPFVGRYAKAMGMVFMDRGSTRAAARSTREAAEIVRGGASLCVFPEGSRSRDGRVAPFKGGAFQIAIDGGADVVPVAIDGSGAVLGLEGLFRVRPGRITVTFGTPLRTQGAERGELARRARAEVVAMLGHVEEAPDATLGAVARGSCES